MYISNRKLSTALNTLAIAVILAVAVWLIVR